MQTASGERSFTVTTESVANLPLANRTFESLLSLAPGVTVTPGELNPAARIGGGGGSNYMLDGATAMDPGINRPATRVSVESLAEVRVVTSTYQAEYARSSGLQINAVTKSGTNQFRGSVYNVARNSKWNSNRKTNELNGDPKPFEDEMDWGFALGGPVGRAGGRNKLFFYFNTEFNPRTFGNDVNRYRVPTALERQGDFSQSRDNLGNLYPYIKDPLLAGTCSASDTRACFQDGGVIGRIPQGRLYQTGLNILKWWPEPNIAQPQGQAYNYESVDPKVDLLGYQPIIRVDYQPTPSIRGSFKFLEYQQPTKVIPGTIPGFNDTQEHDYGIWMPAGTFNWTVTPTMFVEASFGANFHHQEGCSITGGEPNYCRTGLSVTSSGNRALSGFGDIPYLFPDATVLDPETFTYWVLNKVDTTMWDGTTNPGAAAVRLGHARRQSAAPQHGAVREQPWRHRRHQLHPRHAQPHLERQPHQGGGPAHAQDGLLLLPQPAAPRLGQRHRQHQLRQRHEQPARLVVRLLQRGPRRLQHLFADVALGRRRVPRGQPRGLRPGQLARLQQAHARLRRALRSHAAAVRRVRLQLELPARGVDERAGATALRRGLRRPTSIRARRRTAGRWIRSPARCSDRTRRSRSARWCRTPGRPANGLFAAGQGPVAETNHTYPALGVTPRVGAAWDVKGNQQFVVRGGAGLFYDRAPANSVYGTVSNPPFTRNVTVRYGELQNMSSTGLATEAPPALTVWQYDNKLSASTQWNLGIQMALPFAAALDVAYAGQHSFDANTGVNLNAIDLGAAFLPVYQNPALATSASSTDPATSYVSSNPDLIRFYRGYAAINQQQPIGWRTYHSIQIALNRRFRNGLLFGFNDTIGLSDMQSAALRLQHNADGTITVRADQSKADELLGDNHPQAHLMRAHFVWNLPKVPTSTSTWRVIGAIVNDWSLSGIWSGASGTAYSNSATYQSGGGNVNLTGSPDFAPRVQVVSDPGAGCSSDPLRQFNTDAFRGPLVAATGSSRATAISPGASSAAWTWRLRARSSSEAPAACS